MRFSVLASVFLLTACSSSPDDTVSDQPVSQETGGAPHVGDAGATTGGSKATGGNGGSGGSKATGGSVGSGGATSTGGATGAGGKTGTGGSTGTGGYVSDAAPPTPCSALGAIDTWQNVSPSVSGSGNGVLTVSIDPRDHASVYATIDKKGLHRSSDCGASWTKLNTGRNASVIDSGSQWVYVIDPTDGNVMYTSPLYGSDLRLFKSTNAGVDWDPIFEKGGNVEQAVEYIFTEIFSIDTANHNHLAVNFHVNCKAPHKPVCLAETYDAGATWTIIEGPPSLGGWVEDAGPVVINDVIYLGIPFTGLFRSADHGATWTKVSHDGYFEAYRSTNGYTYMGGAQTKLQRSQDLTTWSEINNTPWNISNAIISDGRRIFAASRASIEYVTSPESDGLTFTKMTAPPTTVGAKMFAYDKVNHVLYSANQSGGLFRLVTY